MKATGFETWTDDDYAEQMMDVRKSLVPNMSTDQLQQALETATAIYLQCPEDGSAHHLYFEVKRRIELMTTKALTGSYIAGFK